MTNRNLASWIGCIAVATGLLALLPTTATTQRLVQGEEEEFPHVQYADSLYSLNDRCIVRLRKLSVRIPAAYVNGLPIGFC